VWGVLHCRLSNRFLINDMERGELHPNDDHRRSDQPCLSRSSRFMRAAPYRSLLGRTALDRHPPPPHTQPPTVSV